MDLLKKIEVFVNDEISTGDVAVNNTKGNIDVIGGECPKGTVYDKVNKVCVPVKKESTLVGGVYINGTSNVAGSGQTRVVGRKVSDILDLARKEPVETEFDDPTKSNMMGRKGLKFDKDSGAYIPSLWGK